MGTVTGVTRPYVSGHSKIQLQSTLLAEPNRTYMAGDCCRRGKSLRIFAPSLLCGNVPLR